MPATPHTGKDAAIAVILSLSLETGFFLNFAGKPEGAHTHDPPQRNILSLCIKTALV